MTPATLGPTKFPRAKAEVQSPETSEKVDGESVYPSLERVAARLERGPARGAAAECCLGCESVDLLLAT